MLTAITTGMTVRLALLFLVIAFAMIGSTKIKKRK